MATYWQEFPGFVPNSRAPLRAEFERLAALRGWKVTSKKGKGEWQRCLAAEFNTQYGNTDTRLHGWQALCREVGVEPQGSITQCKKVLRGVWVNIVDLMDARRTHTKVTRFRSAKDLREYTGADGSRVFSKEKAKRNGFLKVLLISVF